MILEGCGAGVVGRGVVAPLVAWESTRGKGGVGGEYVIEWSLQKGLGRGTILSLAAMGLHCHPHPTTIPFQTGSTCPSALLSGSLCYLPYQRPVLAFNTPHHLAACLTLPFPPLAPSVRSFLTVCFHHPVLFLKKTCPSPPTVYIDPSSLASCPPRTNRLQPCPSQSSLYTSCSPSPRSQCRVLAKNVDHSFHSIDAVCPLSSLTFYFSTNLPR